MSGEGTEAPAIRPRDRWLLAGWACLLTVLVGFPLAQPGYVLSYDLVGVPDQALLPATLGLDSALPRAVPLDAVVAVLDSVVPGWAVQRGLFVAVVVLAVLGAAAAVPATSSGARAVAGTAYAWNPYVAERLVLGHWALLLAYALLPWIVVLARRAEDRRALAGVLLLVALASLTPSGGVLAAATLAVVLTSRLPRLGVRRWSLGLGVTAVLQAPWVVPSLLHASGASSDPAGVRAFAAEADSPYGLLLSLVTGGGVWNDQVVPVSRTTLTGPGLALVLLAVAVLGLGALVRGWGRAVAGGLLGLGALGLLLALLPSLPGGAGLLERAVVEVPGAGLLRDGHKFVAWALVPLAGAAGLGAERLARRVRGAWPRRTVLAVIVLLPIAALPDLAGGALGRLSPAEYPRSWAAVRAVLDEGRAVDGGDLVVLPFQPFRQYAWNDQRTVLDPAPRFMRVPTVLPDDLPVDAGVVRGEDARADAVAAALTSADPAAGLAQAGVGWVLLDRVAPGDVPAGLQPGLRLVAREEGLDLFRVERRVEPWDDVPSTAVVGGADAVVLGVLLALVLVLLGPRATHGRTPALVQSDRS